MPEPVTRCIDCGGRIDSLNEDEDGIPCPSCAERLLEDLPGVFHTPWGLTAGVQPDDSSEVEVEASDDDAAAS